MSGPEYTAIAVAQRSISSQRHKTARIGTDAIIHGPNIRPVLDAQQQKIRVECEIPQSLRVVNFQHEGGSGIGGTGRSEAKGAVCKNVLNGGGFSSQKICAAIDGRGVVPEAKRVIGPTGRRRVKRERGAELG